MSFQHLHTVRWQGQCSTCAVCHLESFLVNSKHVINFMKLRIRQIQSRYDLFILIHTNIEHQATQHEHSHLNLHRCHFRKMQVILCFELVLARTPDSDHHRQHPSRGESWEYDMLLHISKKKKSTTVVQDHRHFNFNLHQTISHTSYINITTLFKLFICDFLELNCNWTHQEK